MNSSRQLAPNYRGQSLQQELISDCDLIFLIVFNLLKGIMVGFNCFHSGENEDLSFQRKSVVTGIDV